MALFRPAGEGRRLRTQVAPAATGTAHTSTAKKSEANTTQAIDGALLALTLGATFVARSVSGDKVQLVPIIQAGLAHRGFAFIDIISPCVTFNDHDGSTKSYAYTREHKVEVVRADFVPPADEISADYEAGSAKNVMMHDGSWVKFRKLAKDYDPTNRAGVPLQPAARPALPEQPIAPPTWSLTCFQKYPFANGC